MKLFFYFVSCALGKHYESCKKSSTKKITDVFPKAPKLKQPIQNDSGNLELVLQDEES